MRAYELKGSFISGLPLCKCMLKRLEEHNAGIFKQYHMKILLNSFHLNGYL